MDEDRYFPADVEIDEPASPIQWWRRALAAAPVAVMGAAALIGLCTAPRFAPMFDSFGPEPLPVLTEFCLQWWRVGLAIIALTTVAGAAAGWHRESRYSGILAGAAALVILVTVVVFVIAMYLPTMTILDHLGG